MNALLLYRVRWQITTRKGNQKNMKTYPEFEQGRTFLKSPINAPSDMMDSDEDRKVEAPPFQKEYPEDGQLIDLVSIEELSIGKTSFVEVLTNRKSRRKYTNEALSLEEISFLLWAVQGVHRVARKPPVTHRTVPASGGIHPFETYLVINRVEAVHPGLYRYLPSEHKLLFLRQICSEWLARLGYACRGQEFVGKGAVVFIWTTIPYRTEWRYANEAHKAIAQASGHVCQNLYLASEAIGAGTCAITAYAQQAMDTLIEVDGEQEFTIYLAPVGKV
jgi:SagB-type dehydrogenase family enzyme